MSNDVWLTVSAFLAGVVAALLGAWAVHSVTQGQLNTAISSQEKLFNANLEALKGTLALMDRKIDSMQLQLDRRINAPTAARILNNREDGI